MKNRPKILLSKYRALLISASLLAVMLLCAPPAFSEVREIKGNATGNLYHKDSFKWTEEPIRVFAVYDKKYLDNLTYIVGGKDDYEARGLLFEYGQPGQANTDAQLQRKKFVKMLKVTQVWLETATKEQVSETRHLSRIYVSFNVDMVPGEDGQENTLRIKIKDHGKKRRLSLHLNSYQVGQLILLLEQVPDAFHSMIELYGVRPVGGSVH